MNEVYNIKEISEVEPMIGTLLPEDVPDGYILSIIPPELEEVKAHVEVKDKARKREQNS